MTRRAWVSILAVAAAVMMFRTAGAGPYTDGLHGISYDDPRFVGWATGIEMHWPAGFTPGGGYDDTSRALGPAPGTSNDVVVFGNEGWAVLTFDSVIYNDPGPDLAVFENGFNVPTFAELAFVEVSSDGVHYARFPSVSLNAWPGEYGALDSTNVYNLAGKHVNNNDQAWMGTPFDLDDLLGEAAVTAGLVDLECITHVKIVDIYGHSDGVTTDEATSLIDPTTGSSYATDHVIYDGGNYGGLLAGFDLDAVGLLRPLPGDADGDGDVDGADLAVWQENYDPLGYKGNTFGMGDWDGDGDVDGADLALWQDNYNPLGISTLSTKALGAAGSSSGAVGEPASLSLLALAFSALAARRAARKRNSGQRLG